MKGIGVFLKVIGNVIISIMDINEVFYDIWFVFVNVIVFENVLVGYCFV